MTITRGLGFSINTKTGAIERWAADNPAGVAEHLGKVTGHPPGMLQDDSRELSAWLSSKPDAMMHARDAAAVIRAYAQPIPCAVCCVGHVTLQHDEAGYYRSCEACGSDYVGAAELALNRKP